MDYSKLEEGDIQKLSVKELREARTYLRRVVYQVDKRLKQRGEVSLRERFSDSQIAEMIPKARSEAEALNLIFGKSKYRGGHSGGKRKRLRHIKELLNLKYKGES